MRLFKSYLLFVIALAFTLSNQVFAAPAAELWERWSSHQADSDLIIDHSTWNSLVERFVSESKDGINRVDYSDFKSTDRQQLQSYISALSKTPISQYRRNEQLAFWINLYNAVTVKVVLDNYPVLSIRDIKSGFFTFGPWDKDLVKVEDVILTLNDIEHRILRPIWRDARIHYAVNCASIGCPNLQSIAFTSSNAESLLDKAAVDYINHPRAVRLQNGKLRVSSIFNWYKADFGDMDVRVIDHIRQYAKPSLISQLAGIKKIDGDDYDWSINSLSNTTEKPNKSADS